MKDLSTAICRYIVPLYGTEHTRYHATPPVSRRIEALTWDPIDNIASELYYDIREVADEQVEQQALMARTA